MSPHRCAVCWERQDAHAEWFTHVTDVHGGMPEGFGFSVCSQYGNCPGEKHARRLPNEGAPPQRKAVDLGQPVKTRDGTTYTPIPLPLGPP